MNHISDKLRAKLPPSDTRLRPDLKAWEAAELDLATKEKDRLEENQRKRRKIVTEQLEKRVENKELDSFDISDERTYYCPRYFEKVEEKDEEGNADWRYE